MTEGVEVDIRQSEAVRRIEAWLAAEQAQRTVLGSGAPEGVEERDGGRFVYEYDERGDLVRIVEAGGRISSYCYDSRRRLVRAVRADGSRASYRYDERDRLAEMSDRGVRFVFEYDGAGRLSSKHRGDAGAVAYRYDERDRVVEYRTARVSIAQDFDAAGHVTALRQSIDGDTLELRLDYDAAGRLSEVRPPGGAPAIRYEWDGHGRPARIAAGVRAVAQFRYADAEKACRIDFANGLTARTVSDPVDSRITMRELVRGDEVIERYDYEYDAAGKLVCDGGRRYEYDALARLRGARCLETGESWAYSYDALDNRTAPPAPASVDYDRQGRVVGKFGGGQERAYRYNDAGELIEALDHGNLMARFLYDGKGRLAAMETPRGTERFLYGPADELFAVAGGDGRLPRLFVHTPFGCIAEIRGEEICFLHCDERGACGLVTDERGCVIARPLADPYGLPLCDAGWLRFAGRTWNAAAAMYLFGGRWYDPELGRFLTPDPYTAAPDDARIVHPLASGCAQAALREWFLPVWLKRPRGRNPYVYCGNDPVGRVDPDGHWSFGRVLLSLLGAIWTLPNTLFGLLIEITCLIGEVVRWLVWLVTLGHVSWETPGFDAAASGRLNAFALVFTGGWLGSFSSLLGITFGNVFFVYKNWRGSSLLAGGGTVSPPAYGGSVSFPRAEALYEHELRHTSQYGWFGPFFHLGLPVFGVYEWDVILHGYENALLEQDARDYGGI
jgi:RHS repeat-associated protein